MSRWILLVDGRRITGEKAEDLVGEVACLFTDEFMDYARNLIASVDSDMGGAPSPAEVLGRLGGLKGGPARARALSPAKRSAIARKAALARWERKP